MSLRKGVTTTQAVVIIVIIVIAGVSGAYFFSRSAGPGPATTTTTAGGGAVGTINIGILEPFTGFASLWGHEMYETAQLAASEINAAGGVNGLQVRIFAADEGYGGSQTITAFNELVLRDNVSYVIGPYSSGDYEAILPLIDRYHTIVMSTTSSLMSVFQCVPACSKYIFRDYVNDSMTALNLIQFITKITTTKSIVLAGEDYFYTHEIADLAMAAAPQYGFKVLAADYFPGSTLDYTSEVLKIASLNPGATVMVMSGSNGINFIKQYKQNAQTSKIPLIAAQGALINDPPTVANLEESQPGILDNILMEDWFYNQNLTSRTPSFVSNWQHSFGVYPNMELQGFTYDAVYIFANAIKAAGTPNTDAVVTAMENLEYTGVVGVYKFTHLHSLYVGPGGMLFPIVQFQKGKAVTIYPSEIANGQYLPPT